MQQPVVDRKADRVELGIITQRALGKGNNSHQPKGASF